MPANPFSRWVPGRQPSLCKCLVFSLVCCPGMKILADYKKRKDLRSYLPHEEHWKLKTDKSERKSLSK